MTSVAAVAMVAMPIAPPTPGTSTKVVTAASERLVASKPRISAQRPHATQEMVRLRSEIASTLIGA